MNRKLQQARFERHWSMVVAAQHVGVSRVTYMRWENGEQLPHETTLMLLCKAFKMSPAQLGFGQEKRSDKSQPGVLTLPEAGIALDIPMVLAFLWHTSRCSFQELQEQVTEAMDHLAKTTGTKPLSRREMLSFLIGVPAAVAGSALIGSSGSLSSDEILPLYATGIPACWKLYFSGDWQQVRGVLPSYIAQLTALAQSSGKGQQTASGFLSQAHQLAAFVSLDEENFGASLTHCNQAFEYGKLAGDPNLQAASLMRCSDMYYYRGLPTLEINQRVVKYAEAGQVSPLLRGRLFSDWGACLADNGQRQDALRYLGMAQDVFPDDSTSDPAYKYTLQTRYALYLNEALAHLRLGEPKEAVLAISKAYTRELETDSPSRIDLEKHLIMASISMNDLEQCFTHFENMRLTTVELHSPYWQTELQHLALQLRAKWPQEKRVRQLQETIRGDGEGME